MIPEIPVMQYQLWFNRSGRPLNSNKKYIFFSFSCKNFMHLNNKSSPYLPDLWWDRCSCSPRANRADPNQVTVLKNTKIAKKTLSIAYGLTVWPTDKFAHLRLALRYLMLNNFIVFQKPQTWSGGDPTAIAVWEVRSRLTSSPLPSLAEELWKYWTYAPSPEVGYRVHRSLLSSPTSSPILWDRGAGWFHLGKE